MSALWEDPEQPTIGAGQALGYRRDAGLRRTLGLADVAAVLAALGLVTGLDGDGLRLSALLLAPLTVVISKALGLYDRDRSRLRKTTLDEFPLVFNLAVLVTLVVWLAQGAVLREGLSRPQVFGLLVGCFALVAAGRGLARLLVRATLPEERCLFLGGAPDYDRLIDKVGHSPGVKVSMIGRIPLEPELGRPARDCIGQVQALPGVIAQHAVERVIVAPDTQANEAELHAIRMVKALGIKVSVLPRLLEVVGSSSHFDEIDGITLLGLRQFGLTSSSQLLKRTLDVTVSAVLLVALSPVMLLLALLIRLDSPGPVFFRQARIGRRGQRFEMLKFRSMVADAEGIKAQLHERNEAEGGMFKISGDPRITRVGRLVRSSSLDELPQLLNVLAGHMSLVGPRPLIPDEDALIEGWERRRLTVRPGMTGLWQIYGSSRIPMPEMVKIDYLYGANWSIWLDLKILLRTVPYVLQRRGM